MKTRIENNSIVCSALLFESSTFAKIDASNIVSTISDISQNLPSKKNQQACFLDENKQLSFFSEKWDLYSFCGINHP